MGRMEAVMVSMRSADINGNLLGNEFQVNTYTESYQRYPAIAMNDEGFVITWYSAGQDGSNYSIYAQQYDIGGNPLGNEFQVNTYTENTQCYPAIAMNDEGYIITWQSKDQDGSNYGIYAQRYDIGGNPLGNEFQVNTYTQDNQRNPAITMNDKRFIITWTSYGQDGSEHGVYAQRYDDKGNPVGQEFQVNSETEDSQLTTTIAMDNDGFVISWKSSNVNKIFAKRFKTYTIPSGSNLAATFLPPVVGNYTGTEDFPVNAIASDAYMDKYTLSINNGTENLELITEEGRTARGELYYFNILDAAQGEENTVKLEVWDKAGNYRQDEFTLIRDYESLIENFGIAEFYVSDNRELLASFELQTECQVSFDIEDEDGSLLASTDVGEMSSSNGITIDTSGLDDNSYYLCLRAAHSTLTEAESRVQFVLDNTNPETSLGDLDDFYSDQLELELATSIQEENLASFTLKLINTGNNTENILSSGNSFTDLDNIGFNPGNFDEGPYTLRLDAEDLAGNTGFAESSFVIDRTAPSIVSISPNFSAIQNGNITFSAAASDEGGFSDYILRFTPEQGSPVIIDSGTSGSISCVWDSAAVGEIVEGAVEYVLNDCAGNTKTCTYSIIADNNPPVTALYFNEEPFPDNGDIYISGTNTINIFSDPNDDYSDVESVFYRFNSGAWNNYTDAFTLGTSGRYTIEYYAIDSFGNTSEIRNSELISDSTPPSCEAQIAPPKYEKNDLTFISSENNITLTPDDGSLYSSGVKHCLYRINNGIWEDYSESLSVFQDGPITIYSRVMDNVGNVFESDVSTVVIDLAPPVTTFDTETEYYRSVQKRILALKEEAELTLSAADSGTQEYQSGVCQTWIDLDGDESVYTGSFTISHEEPKEYTFFSIDNVGNRENAEPVTIAVDTEGPSVTCELPDNIYISGNVVFTTGGQVFELTAEDNFSGVNDICYSINGNEYEKYEGNLSWQDEADFQLTYYAEDNLGWESEIGQTEISIDNTPPVTQTAANIQLVNIDDQMYADQRYVFSWISSDFKSGVANTFVTIDNVPLTEETYTFTTDGEHLITYYSTDNLGNREDENQLVIITPIPDTTPPITTLSRTEEPYSDGYNDYYCSSVIFSLSAQDILGGMDSYASGVDKIYYSIDNGSFNEYTSDTTIGFEEEGIHSIKYYSVDTVGNSETQQIYYLTIDNTPPVTSHEFLPEDYILTDGILYITESDQISFISEDSLSGVREIYCYVDDETEINIYIEPFSLPKGSYVIGWYAQDNLGNTEEINTQAIEIIDDYETLSYSTNYVDEMKTNVVDYDADENRVVWLEGRNRSDIYLRQITEGPNDNAVKLTHRSEARIQIALGQNWAASIEQRNNWKELYIYSTDRDTHGPGRRHDHLYGIPVSIYCNNRDPLFTGDILYWIKEDDYNNYIYEYDPETEFTTLIYETSEEIRDLKEKDGILTFIQNSPAGQEIRIRHDGTFETIYTCNDTDNPVLEYSVHGDNLAIETKNSSEESIISVYSGIYGNNILFTEVSGRMPMLDNNELYFIADAEDSEILTKYNLSTGISSYLLKSSQIINYIPAGQEDLFVNRENGPDFMNSSCELLFDLGNSRNRNRGWSDWFFNHEYLYLDKEDTEILVDEIQFASGRNDFAYNTYLDNEDFIYADEFLTVPGLFSLRTDVQQIQTFNSDKTGSTENPYLSFTALEDIEVVILMERDSPHWRWENSRNGKWGNDELRNQLFIGELSYLNSLFRMNIITYSLNAGEEFHLDTVDPYSNSPLVFVYKMQLRR